MNVFYAETDVVHCNVANIPNKKLQVIYVAICALVTIYSLLQEKIFAENHTKLPQGILFQIECRHLEHHNTLT